MTETLLSMWHRVRSSRRMSAAIAALCMMTFLTICQVASAMTDSVTVEPSTVTDMQSPIVANDLRPQQCVDHNTSVNHVVSGDGSADLVGPHSDGDLLLAALTTETIHGGAGDDCIVGTVGTQMFGGGGTNTCIGDVTLMDADCTFKEAG